MQTNHTNMFLLLRYIENKVSFAEQLAQITSRKTVKINTNGEERSVWQQCSVLTCVIWALLLGLSGSSAAVFAAAIRLAVLSSMSSAASRMSVGEILESAGIVAAMPRDDATSCFNPSAVYLAALPVSSVLPWHKQTTSCAFHQHNKDWEISTISILDHVLHWTYTNSVSQLKGTACANI